jgi:hypothetical protein
MAKGLLLFRLHRRFWARIIKAFSLFTPDGFRAAGFARSMICRIKTRKVEGWPLSMSCPTTCTASWG